MPETLESLLSRKAVLDALLGNIERGALVFAIIVGVGVVGEAVYSFRAWWNNRKLHVVQQSIDQLRQGNIATLGTVLEEARQETARLEAIVAGRQLTKEQSSDLTESMRTFASRELFITSYSGDAEAARLGLQIKLALGKAKLKVADELGRSIASGGGVSFGIVVSGPTTDKDLIDALAKSLRAHGKLDARGAIVEPTMRIGRALTGIMVALKPVSETKE